MVRLLVVQHQPAFIVGEPDDELLLLVGAVPINSSVTLLMRNFFSCLRSQPSSISTCRKSDAIEP